MHLSQLHAVLCGRYPELAHFTEEKVHRYADLMMQAISPGARKHKKAGVRAIPEAAISFDSAFLERNLGRGGFRQMNDIADCFGVSNTWNMAERLTKAYWLSDQGNEVVHEAIDAALEGQEGAVVDENGHRIRRKPNGVYTARDANGKRAVTDAKLRYLVPLNMDALEDAMATGVREIMPNLSEKRARLVEKQILTLLAAGNCSQFGRGNLPQTYREISSGRLCGQGGLSLQNVAKETRYLALRGSHEYDYSNCHCRLLDHAAREHGIEAPEIAAYANDPQAYRTQFAQQFDLTRKQAKDCLIAVLYGATKNPRPENRIPALIGPEKAIELYADERFEALSLEVTEIGHTMREHAPVLRSGRMVNCRGKARKGNPRKLLGHLLQGMESELLHLVVRHYGQRILIIQHDGFTMSEYVDPVEIEELIFRETGIRMPVTYQLLGMPNE